MIMFSIAAVLLSALAAALILQRASGAARRTDADPTLALYRRQLTEMDELAERGLMGEAELKAAKAEAARRLLNAAKGETLEPPASETPRVSRAMRLAVLAGAVAAPAIAVGLYLLLGAPGTGDQPYADRLKAWTNGDPGALSPAQMAAVLETVAKQRPGDAEPLTYLARAQMASNNPAAAADTMRKAIRLEPKDADLWSNLGIILLTQGQGEETKPAQDAFAKAVAIDPKNPAARYHLARAKLGAGDLANGLAGWRALAADLPQGDAQRRQLEDEIAATEKAGHLVVAQAQAQRPAPQQQDAQGGVDPNAVVGALTGQVGAGQAPQGGPPLDANGAPDPRQMVARLEAQMRQDPNNLPGWLRLIRSYAVLGLPDKEKAAIAQAHQIFRGNAQALQAIDSAAAAPQGAE